MWQRLACVGCAFYLLCPELCTTRSRASGFNSEPTGTLLFQTDRSWSPRTNIGADTVLVYGLDSTTAARVQSWTAHGYRAAIMTGVAWGRYAPYLDGSFDGRQHWDQTQQEAGGKLILHDGREVPYISPNAAYGKYLASGVLSALDAGAQAVYLEEPEFWADAGWSASFRLSWTELYHQPWQPPDASVDAQYRASALKYLLYRNALQQVFSAVRAYSQKHGRTIPCYVATHSLLNYAQWNIVSPEFSLLQAGADGFIGQVWTGTARTPNVYEGSTRERTFETAFLEYGALQNISRFSGKPIWYLNDPIEDNPNHSWTDYRLNWESTLIASLLQPAVSRYEVLPWPHRIFGEAALYPSAEPQPSRTIPPKIRIPEAYATELQTVFHALGDMWRYNGQAQWEQAGTEGLGVLVSDTLMFQRAAPMPSDPHLGQFYGLALPLLLHGMLVEAVSMEGASSNTDSARVLAPFKVLLLSYEGQKPPSAAFHQALAAWVRAGGALIVVDDDKDPYNDVNAWWKTGAHHDATPRYDLFRRLGMNAETEGLQHAGKGVVLYSAQSPTSLSEQVSGARMVLRLLQTVMEARHEALKESRALVLRRGPYVVAAGLDLESDSAPPAVPVTVTGDLIDLLDAALKNYSKVEIKPGSRVFSLDLDRVAPGPPRVLAASARITREHVTSRTLTFDADGIEDTPAVVSVLSTDAPTQVLVSGKPLSSRFYFFSGRTLLIHLTNHALPQTIEVKWSSRPDPT